MGYYDENGVWRHQESDPADPGGGFSGLLNLVAASLSRALPNLVAEALADDPTIRQAVLEELEGLDLMLSTDPRIPVDAPSPVAWGAKDGNDRYPLWVHNNGVTHAEGGIEAPRFNNMKIELLNTITGYVMAIMDKNRRAPIAIRRDGTVDLVPSNWTRKQLGGGGGDDGGGRALPRDADGSDIIVLIGQSNAQGGGAGYDPELDPAVDGINQLAGSGPQAGQVIPAVDALYHVNQYLTGGGAPRVGPAMEIARNLWLDQPTNRNVLIVPAALGSTSVIGDENNSWDPDNTTAARNLAHRAAAEITKALALHPRNRVRAIYWVQGEHDAMASTDPAWYRGKLIEIIDLMRGAAGEDVPFIIGSMVPEWYEARPAAVALDAAQREVTERIPGTAYVPGPRGLNQDNGGIHYNAAGARELGRRLYDAIPGAHANTLPEGS